MLEFSYRGDRWRCGYLIAPILNEEDRGILLRGICDMYLDGGRDGTERKIEGERFDGRIKRIGYRTIESLIGGINFDVELRVAVPDGDVKDEMSVVVHKNDPPYAPRN